MLDAVAALCANDVEDSANPVTSAATAAIFMARSISRLRNMRLSQRARSQSTNRSYPLRQSSSTCAATIASLARRCARRRGPLTVLWLLGDDAGPPAAAGLAAAGRSRVERLYALPRPRQSEAEPRPRAARRDRAARARPWLGRGR